MSPQRRPALNPLRDPEGLELANLRRQLIDCLSELSKLEQSQGPLDVRVDEIYAQVRGLRGEWVDNEDTPGLEERIEKRTAELERATKEARKGEKAIGEVRKKAADLDWQVIDLAAAISGVSPPPRPSPEEHVVRLRGMQEELLRDRDSLRGEMSSARSAPARRDTSSDLSVALEALEARVALLESERASDRSVAAATGELVERLYRARTIGLTEQGRALTIVGAARAARLEWAALHRTPEGLPIPRVSWLR